MKKFISFTIMLLTLFVAGIFYMTLSPSDTTSIDTSKNEKEITTASTEPATENSVSIHSKFTESFLAGEIGIKSEDEKKMKAEKAEMLTQTSELWMNEEGHFRLVILSGPDAGNFLVWNGIDVYHFDEHTGQLTITPETVKVIPHIVFSKETTRRLKEDFQQGEVVKGKDKQYLGRDVLVFTNEVTINGEETGLYEQYPSIYKPTENKEKSVMYVDKELDIALMTETKTNGKITDSYEMEVLETGIEFDPSLLEVDQSLVKTTVNTGSESSE